MKSPTIYSPVHKSFFTPGMLVLFFFIFVGLCFALARFVFGLGSITNLSNQYPWGIWIAVDVASGVALAAGGFITAALVHIFSRHHYETLIRPALLTAWLGYLFVAIGLLADLGRYYNIWHPMIYWQGNSVLFEVGLCVMTYLTVLTIEFLPTLLEGIDHYTTHQNPLSRYLKSLHKPAKQAQHYLRKVMPLFIIAGVVLSFMHQSSLGSLMLIAPSKLSSLWYTPILPLLFLSSAIVAGFAMVIIESLAASNAFNRRPETHLLNGLGRYIIIFLGIYGIMKIGDLLVRQPGFPYGLFSVESVSFLIEILFGIALPLILFLMPQTYRSHRLLFTSSALIVFGIVLNRINVFLVGYHPPYAEFSYFPSIGEIAITLGLISTIIVLYRFFATYFPILPTENHVSATPETSFNANFQSVYAKTISLLIIVSTVISILTLSSANAQNQTNTIDSMPSLLLLDRLETDHSSDHFGTVRFMHKKHATLEKGDCTVCHHRAPRYEGDTVGQPIYRFDLEKTSVVSCQTCHDQPLSSDALTRLGLKGAFHRRCLDCHAQREAGPQSCNSCHRRNVPDHSSFITLEKENIEPQTITRQCLECHQSVKDPILHSAHWRWTGHSPDTLGHEKQTSLGKKNVINNYCVHIGSNWERCSMCHIGYGWKDETFDFNNPDNIDCLVCHDTTGTYKKDPVAAGYPSNDVDLIAVAKQVGHPSRENCGACHFKGGGGDGVKHGDMDSSLLHPSAALDVHMGKHNFLCQDCHVTKDHQIQGACFAIPSHEGRISCESCHTSNPHQGSTFVNAHLNEHSKSIACQTCHIPQFARGLPTKLAWDWSTAGSDLPENTDEYGKPTFHKKKGTFKWGKNVVPEYAWYNSKNQRYLLGDPITPDSVTVLNKPVGEIHDPSAKIAPFKIHRAIQISDAQHQYLIVPNLWKGFWKHYDWDQAAKDGMKSVGLPYSGDYEFVSTEMYWKINHQVAPKSEALSCYQCHDPEHRCTTCHSSNREIEQIQLKQEESRQLAKRDENFRFPFKPLGYSHDPISKRGRFERLLDKPESETSISMNKKDDQSEKTGDDNL